MTGAGGLVVDGALDGAPIELPAGVASDAAPKDSLGAAVALAEGMDVEARTFRSDATACISACFRASTAAIDQAPASVGRFTDSYPWEWLPGDVEDFTTSLFSGPRPLSRSTVRIYHLTLRAFCDFVTDQRYDWVAECRSRFGSVPTQVCFEWNTVAHTVDFERTPGRRPLDYDELDALFGVADARVETLRGQGRKGALAALRDAQLLKTIYAWGLRRREALGLDVVDLRMNAKTPQWGRFGLLHVRHGKSSKGSIPKRRSVLSLPEFDWAIDGLRVYVEQVREKLNPGNHPGLWPTERGTRVGDRYLDRRFAQLRDEAGLPGELTLHSLRHSYVTHLIELG